MNFMKYQVNFGFHAFAVPSAIVDHFIRLADETHLKVILYLLRHPEQNFTPVQIASFLKIRPEIAEEAMEFWAQVNILQEAVEETQPEFEISALAKPIVHADPMPVFQQKAKTASADSKEKSAPKPEIKPQSKPQSQHKPQPKSHNSYELAKFSNADIADMKDKSPEIQKLVYKFFNISGHEPNATELRSLIWLHDYLGFSNAIILALLQYCKDMNRFSVAYIEKIAYNWWEDDILTYEEAEQKIQELKDFYTYTAYIKRLFGMSVNPTKAQKEFIELWQAAGYPEELLLYAHDLTVESIAKQNFKYIHKILTGWAKNGIRTKQEAEKTREEYIKSIEEEKKKKNKRKEDNLTPQETERLNKYLTVVNRFRKD